MAAMNRHSSRQGILDSLARIRKWLPDVVLRSTVMVGFPGETEQDFEELLDFLQQAQFDWLGVFPYYQEEDTPAAAFKNQLDSDIKQERVDRVMQLSAVVTQGRLEKYIDKKMPVLAETPAFEFGENWHQGRCQYQAPEVDGVVYFYSEQKEINYGSVYQVQINKSDIYDLMGVII